MSPAAGAGSVPYARPAVTDVLWTGLFSSNESSADSGGHQMAAQYTIKQGGARNAIKRDRKPSVRQQAGSSNRSRHSMTVCAPKTVQVFFIPLSRNDIKLLPK